MSKKKTQPRTGPQTERASTSRKATDADVVRSSPLKLVRPGRLARLLDCDPSTIWRYEQNGTLPPPIVICGVKGLAGA